MQHICNYKSATPTNVLGECRAENILPVGMLSYLIHYLPVYQPLALAVELHGKAYDLSLVGLERLGIAAVTYLPLGCGKATIV